MSKIQRIAFSILIFAVCTGFDRVTKSIAQDKLIPLPPISLLNGMIRFQYSENPGAMLSLGANLDPEFRFILFIILIGLMLAALYIYLITARDFNRAQLAGLFIMVSGGAGNFIDRLTNQGAAIDFVSLHLGPLKTGIFNLADVFIFAGAGLAFYATLKAEVPPAEPEPLP